MIRRSLLTLVLVSVAACATSFYFGWTDGTGRAVELAQDSESWLRDAPIGVVEAERQFDAQIRGMMDAVRVEQRDLSAMLSDANVAGEQVLAQAGRVVESRATVLRMVGRHLTQLQDTLSQSQMRSLLESCAGSVRNQIQRRYRWRVGAPEGTRGRGYMGGRGSGEPRGRGGAGLTRQYRGGVEPGRGFVAKLRLTEEQVAWIRQQDPDFDSQVATLRSRLSQVHADLAASLDTARIDGEAFLSQVDNLIDAYGDLELRVAQHLILLRPQLSQEQRDHLSSLLGVSSGL
jgi:hypothetical protein